MDEIRSTKQINAQQPAAASAPQGVTSHQNITVQQEPAAGIQEAIYDHKVNRTVRLGSSRYYSRG